MLYSVVSESHPLPFLDLSGIGLQSLICGSDRACGQPPNLARASERGTVSLRLLRDVSRGERYGSREMVDEGPCGRGTIGADDGVGPDARPALNGRGHFGGGSLTNCCSAVIARIPC